MRWWQRLLGNISLSILSVLLPIFPAQAQMQGDGTLGTQVNGNLAAPCTGNCLITNGTARGGNLFHSFRQFSLPNGDVASFVTTPAIQNVIVRVTGVGQPFISNINGTVATVNATVTAINPTNFFLLNPNGIVFGPNARVLVGGSFLATTADRMLFKDGTEFRTTDSMPLLAINVPIGLGFTGVPQPIKLQDSRLDGRTSFRDFALVGGDIGLDDAQISVRGGRIELAGIGAAGVVGLNLGDNTLRLSVPDYLIRADVGLSNAAILVLPNTTGGGIAINARNLSLSSGNIGAFFLGSQAGDIVLNVTEAIALTQESQIGNIDDYQATGNGGNILIQTGSLSVTGGFGFVVEHLGQRNSGNISINARDTVTFDGGINDAVPSVVSLGDVSGRGNPGEIRISTGTLSLTNGGSLLANNFQAGTAGNITVNARDAILLDGETKDGFYSRISSSSPLYGVGNPGNIQLTTGSLTITNGAKIDATVFSRGNAGNITIAARDAVIFDGRSSSRRLPNGAIGSIASGVNSDVSVIGSGNGGDIRITAGSLSVTNGAELTAETAGQGNAGNLSINTRDRVTIDGTSTDGFASSVRSGASPRAVGNGGEIQLVTNVLAVTNGANLTTGAEGQGNGGRIVVNARDRTIVKGLGSNGNFSSIQSAVYGDQPDGTPFQIDRTGGDIAIITGSLFLKKRGISIHECVVSSRGGWQY